MDERGKSGAFVDVKDSSEHGENIFEETVDVLFRKPTFVIMSLPFHFREAGSTRLLLLTFLFQSSSVLPVLLFVVLLSFRFATCLRWRLDDATLIVVSTAFIIRNDGWVLRRVASITIIMSTKVSKADMAREGKLERLAEFKESRLLTKLQDCALRYRHYNIRDKTI